MMTPDWNRLDLLTENELVELIEYHNRKYWEDGVPEISDTQYDLLTRALARLAPDHPLLSQVQAPSVASEGKIHHETPMLSLDKAYSLEEVMAWGRKFARKSEEPLLVQPKYDGISALWTGSILATRGDGFIGENITDKLPLLELECPKENYSGDRILTDPLPIVNGRTALPAFARALPLASFKGSARGEIVIREDDFRTLYSHIRNRNGRQYKNSRNAVAGIMGLKDIREMLLQKAKLTLVDYSLFSWKTSLDRLESDWPGLLEQAEALPYPMDGIVIKLADTAYSESLGNTAHHPRGQIAFKFSGIRRTSKLISVEWSFGKNCLTPVAEIEPVDISGTTIRRASLHNLQNVLDKDLQIGDTVEVERAGDVIPYIVSAEPGEVRTPCIIDRCPCCGAELVRDLPELRCVNPDCLETRLQNLLASVRNIGIERLGEPNLRKMMTVLGVRRLPDIFRLTIGDLLRLEGWQRQSSENLLNEIRQAKTVPDFQILASLNIKGIGPNIAKSILKVHSLEELRSLTVEELSLLDGIGPERASALWHQLTEHHAELDELLSCVTLISSKGSADSDKPTVCFTGKMPEKRSFYETLAKEHGYEPLDSVTEKLTLLVSADPQESSSKLVKAKKYGVRILALDEFLAELKTTQSSPVTTAPEEQVKKPVSDEPEQLFLGF